MVLNRAPQPRHHAVRGFANSFRIGEAKNGAVIHVPYGTVAIKLMYYVYILECQDDKSWYIGYTADLRERVKRHNQGNGARTTSKKDNWKLIFYEAYQKNSDARRREIYLKTAKGRTIIKTMLKDYLSSNQGSVS